MVGGRLKAQQRVSHCPSQLGRQDASCAVLPLCAGRGAALLEQSPHIGLVGFLGFAEVASEVQEEP